MFSEIKYTGEDLRKLQAIMHSMPILNGSTDAMKDFVEVPDSDRRKVIIIKNAIKTVLGPDKFSIDKQPMQYIKAWIRHLDGQFRGNVAYDIYTFLFFVKFDDVPAYISDPTLSALGFIKWRLEIGK